MKQPRHIRYPSLLNTARKEDLEEVLPLLKNVQCTISEKVHGANFAIYVDSSNNIWYASRNKILSEQENFFNYKEVVEREKLDKKVKALNKEIRQGLNKNKEFKDVNTSIIIIYGELCGGYFPGDAKIEGGKVQKGICYSPRVEFLVFDIAYVRDPKASEQMAFLPQVELPPLLAKHKIKAVPHITQAGLDVQTYLDIDTNIKSTIMNYLDVVEETTFPPKNKDNTMEGVVIRPLNTTIINPKSGDPIVLKTVNEQFREFMKTDKITVEDMNDRVKCFLPYVDARVNANRVASAISKVGVEKNIGPLIREVANDVEQSMEQNAIHYTQNPSTQTIYAKLENKEKAQIKRYLNKKAAEAVKNELFKKH